MRSSSRCEIMSIASSVSFFLLPGGKVFLLQSSYGLIPFLHFLCLSHKEQLIQQDCITMVPETGPGLFECCSCYYYEVESDNSPLHAAISCLRDPQWLNCRPERSCVSTSTSSAPTLKTTTAEQTSHGPS